MNALYMILLICGLVCVRMSIIWYKNDSGYVSQCALCDIIKRRDGIYLNALYMLVLKERCYVSECALYVIIKMRDFMCLNAKYMFS